MRTLTVFFLLLGISLSAQQIFESAYIVTLKGDTVFGEGKVNSKKPCEAHERICFKDKSGIQKNFKPAKLFGYGINDKHFISLEFDGEPFFYQVLSRGEINFYMLTFESIRMNESTYDIEYFIARPDNKRLVTVKQGKFRKQLSDWMEDNPGILEKYPDEKEFDAGQAAAVISEYNSWKAGK